MKSWMKSVLLVAVSVFLATGCGVRLFPPTEDELDEVRFVGCDRVCRGENLPEDVKGYVACREDLCGTYRDPAGCDGNGEPFQEQEIMLLDLSSIFPRSPGELAVDRVDAADCACRRNFLPEDAEGYLDCLYDAYDHYLCPVLGGCEDPGTDSP